MSDLKNTLLVIASAQGILLSFALFFSFKRDKSNPFLGVILSVFSLELLNSWAINLNYHSSDNPIPFWLLGSYLLLPASLWFMVRTSLSNHSPSKRSLFLIYLPALVEISTELFSFILYKTTAISLGLQKQTFWFLFTEAAPIFWMIGVLIYFGRGLYQFTLGSSLFNNTYFIKLVMQFSLLTLLTILWFVESLVKADIFSYIEILFIAILFLLAYLGYFLPGFFERPKIHTLKNLEDSFPGIRSDEAVNRLKIKLEVEKMFLQPKLSIDQLSNELKLPTRYLSALIQTHFQQNFPSLLNSYRVKEVLKKLNDPKEQHKTLLALAFESGFNSKSAFNQAFKEQTGKTPSSFSRKRQLNGLET
jgi:AraC-like DNA-binding protein